MHLTREEEEMYKGLHGEAKALAIKTLVKVGEALGAERLIRISHAHVSGASYMTIGEAGLKFIRDLSRIGAKFSVPTSINPVSYDIEAPGSLPNTPIAGEVLRRQGEILEALRSMGGEITLTCTPYYTEIPSKYSLGRGSHVAWGESSAVAYANSVLGVRTNREGGPLALLAGIAGRTYYSGLHLDENRKPTRAYRLSLARPLDEAEAGILGDLLVELHREESPPLMDAWFGGDAALKEFLAAVSSAGDMAMVYIPGVTPEALSEGVSEVTWIEGEELEDRVARYGPKEPPDIVYVGCPHASVEELRKLGRELKRSGLPGGTGAKIVVSLSRDVYYKALSLGLIEELASQGVSFIRDSCLIVSPFSLHNKGLVIGTNSYKAYFYLSKRGLRVYVAPIRSLLESLRG